MQQITISGYMSKDAEQRQVRDGSVTALNVPVKQGWGDKETTNWYRVNVWGKRADFAGKLTKGTFIVATGELSIGEYNGKPQYEIRASDFQTVSSGERKPSGATPNRSSSPGYTAEDLRDGTPGWDDDSSIPF